MAKIKVLKDEQLKGGIDNTDVYPVSSTQALYSHYVDNGEMKVRQREYTPGVLEPEKLEDRLKDHEDDAVKLHKESEKLTPRVTANSSLFEITGNTNEVTLTGSAQVEVFNPDESKSIPVADMSVKELTLRYGSTTDGPYDTAHAGTGDNPITWIDTIQVPNDIGTYTGRFDVTYNGVSKYATTSIVATVNQYYGFVNNSTVDSSAVLEELIANSAISKAAKRLTSTIGNDVSITLPANGTGTKYTYFAIPSNMSINRVRVGSTRYQYPLGSPVNVERTFNGVTCTWKLYKSVTSPESSEALELIINPLT